MKSIGKYQVVEQLGASAAGTTYRVRDGFRNKEFALKVLETVPGLTAAAKEQFCGHLAACAELVHRHVVKVQDLGEVEEGVFVVSDWRTGVDLGRFMQDNRDLPLGQKMALVAQVAEGLAFAHSREIAHGDLKPSNVFVDGARDVTILDFGIAKWLAALLEAGTRPEGLVVNYLAPEQVLGQPFDGRSDIFALGVMLYEFVSGKYPFMAAPNLIPREIVHTEAEPLRQLDPQIPEELDQLVQRALHKDPAQRLQTAEEFASGLYVAAQELRRRASAAAPPETPRVPETTVPAPEPVLQATAFVTPASVNPTPPQREPEQKVRERPQDKTGPPQPWTARSYKNAPLTKEMPAFQRQPPADPSTAQTAPAPVPTPVIETPVAAQPYPQTGAPVRRPPAKAPLRPPQPVPVQSNKTQSNKTMKRVITVLAGLVLAAGIIGSFLSRQGLRASQDKSPAPVVVSKPSAHATPAITPEAVPHGPEAEASKPGESGPDDVGNPEFSARQTLHGPVRSLWESGRYAEAMALVNQVLANNPGNAEARVWKKKIRDAQEAEAALK